MLISPVMVKSLDLTKESIKTLGVHISNNEKLQDDISFFTAVKIICNVIKLWRMRHEASTEDTITTFKPLAISAIIHLALLTTVPKNIIKELNEIQKGLYGQIKNVKLNMVHCVMIAKMGV